MYDMLSFIVRALSWSVAVQQPAVQQPKDISTSVSLFESIPGRSPLRFCDESRATDLFAIEQIELSPQPLYIDDTFEVHLYGTFMQSITENTTWTYLARYNSSSEYETGTMDFCQTVDHIDQPAVPHRQHECPPQQGFAHMTMSAWVMPMFIVPGNYYFKFDAITNEGERVYCVDAEIHLDYNEDRQTRKRGPYAV